MSNARNLARLIVDSGGDVDVSSLGNVPPSNDASALTTGTLPVGRLPSSGVDASSLTTGSLGTARLPAGSVIQVVQGRNDSISSTINGAGLSLDAVSVSITPTSSTSKILLISEVYAGGSGGQPGATSVFFLRNGSGIGQSSKTGPGIAAIGSMIQSRGYSDGDHMGAAQISYLDSPATTSSITYTTRMTTRTDSSVGLRLNFCWNYSSNTGGFQVPCVSTITALEIAA